jgi:DNA-binding transcriptional regulator GbsR (MarR family)
LRTNGRAAEVIQFEAEVVSFFIDAADMLGVPKSVAAIYAICFASAEPLSFADVHDRLDVSQGSVSQGLRILRKVGALRVVDIRSHPTDDGCLKVGERRDYYTPDLELRKLAYHLIEERLGRQFKGGEARLQAIKAAIPTQDIAAAKELQGRLRQLQGWHGKGQALLPLVKTFLALG